MRKKELVKKILEKNPAQIWHQRRMQKDLKNKEMTFLCPNCIGGIIFHDLGLKFQSPTVNLMFNQRDFVKFVLDLEKYIDLPLNFFKHPEYDCPCAKLGDLTIHFTHYHTTEEAQAKWNERKSRIDWNNMFIFCEERDGISKEEIFSLKSIKARGVVVFTANKYKDIPYAVYIKKYKQDGEVGNILRKVNVLTGTREYEKYFDFVKWFNEANGANFDVSKYIR